MQIIKLLRSQANQSDNPLAAVDDDNQACLLWFSVFQTDNYGPSLKIRYYYHHHRIILNLSWLNM